MTQLSVMDLAKQGDPQAIASLINRSLASKGIHAKAELEAECLKISLQAAQIPNQKAVVTIIHRGIIILQPEKVKRVKILTYRSDNNYLAWQYEIDLVNDFKQPLTTTNKPNLEPDHNLNLVSNPKGVILVQKLSQIKQNLQEYQDIIVRFTDEQVGTVRCLTTLTELIQVISQPSFLFAAVASNPNLRSLLDTIAESSKTDEHGDQVITNLSILQPGQQWQKAKIRLVTKIFLEPAQEEDDPEVKHQGITLDLAETTPESTIYDVPDSNPVIPEIPQSIPPQAVETNLASGSPSTSITISSLFDDAPAPSKLPLQATDNSIESPESITANSLFDDFQAEPRPEIPLASVPTPPIPTPPVPVVNTVVESLESITANSLFDDFQAEPPVQIVDDITANSDFSDSLFDDFMHGHIESVSSYSESVSQVDQLDQVNALPVNTSASPLTDQTNESDDLFGSFASNDSPPPSISLESDVTEIEESIDTIKSRIPKQNLDQLLQLMNEEDQTKAESSSVNEDVNQLDADFGAITIERILGNMDTISINTSDSKSSSNLTLEDFSEDLNSVGF